MPSLIGPPPSSPIEVVSQTLHGVEVPDPYRWLEELNSPRAQAWLAAQADYTRRYFEAIRERHQIRVRVQQLLDVEICESPVIARSGYFFRKRRAGQQQACLYFREGFYGNDELILDPREDGLTSFSSIKPLSVSEDGQYLLYAVREGGERSASFRLFDMRRRQSLDEFLPRGFLRGFVFSPNGRGFYYVYQPQERHVPSSCAAYFHLLGTSFSEDRKVFSIGEDSKTRLHLVSGTGQIGFVVYRFADRIYTSLYLWSLDGDQRPWPVLEDAPFSLTPRLLANGRILALTDQGTPHRRIVEIHAGKGEPGFSDIVPAGQLPIESWRLTRERIFVSSFMAGRAQVHIFDLTGKRLGELPIEADETVRLTSASMIGDDIFFERESFTTPVRICRYSSSDSTISVWSERKCATQPEHFCHAQISIPAKDGTWIPMYLVGKRSLSGSGCHPMVMTAYGGFGKPMTPQFSVLVTVLMERGCIFALPGIRGGSELGPAWHEAAKRQRKQVSWSDFLCAAEWLIATGRAEARRLAIFGGSHSGLLVGVAITQRPDLFRAALCMAPLLDMLRYHRVDESHLWEQEYGTADNADDFAVLRQYSPYHHVDAHTSYPATMLVAGGKDQNCNPLHALKMTARLQAANTSQYPIILDYQQYRGHSPVLPLDVRIEALTDRIAFLSDQLGLSG